MNKEHRLHTNHWTTEFGQSEHSGAPWFRIHTAGGHSVYASCMYIIQCISHMLQIFLCSMVQLTMTTTEYFTVFS